VNLTEVKEADQEPEEPTVRLQIDQVADAGAIFGLLQGPDTSATGNFE